MVFVWGGLPPPGVRNVLFFWYRFLWVCLGGFAAPCCACCGVFIVVVLLCFFVLGVMSPPAVRVEFGFMFWGLCRPLLCVGCVSLVWEWFFVFGVCGVCDPGDVTCHCVFL